MLDGIKGNHQILVTLLVTLFCCLIYKFLLKNSSWDEWVPESRILKYNDANVARQKDLQKSHKSRLQKKSKGSTPKALKSTSKELKSSDVKSDGSVHDSDSR